MLYEVTDKWAHFTTMNEYNTRIHVYCGCSEEATLRCASVVDHFELKAILAAVTREIVAPSFNYIKEFEIGIFHIIRLWKRIILTHLYGRKLAFTNHLLFFLQ